MKRYLVAVALLSLTACGSPSNTAPAAVVPAETPTTSGVVVTYDLGSDLWARDWQHPRTGCWFIVGPGSGRAMLELKDRSGIQICGDFPAPNSVAQVAR